MRVTVVIPCYNVADLVGRALDSALMQDHADLEVILVDDGSTDGTAEVLERHPGVTGGRARLVRQMNRGASAARNHGLRMATGTYVQFLDADDLLMPDKISGQLALAEREGWPDVIVGDYRAVRPDGLMDRVQALYDRPWMALIRTRMGTTSANLWARELLLAVDGWPEELASSQDYALLFTLLKRGARVGWDRRERTEVLKRPTGSISRTGVRANWERYVDLRRRIKEHLVGLGRERYAAEIAALDQYIFMALRILATYDRDQAVKLYRSCIDKGFRPEVGPAITERYVALFTLLGFAGAERALGLARRRKQADA
ncbi:MAG: glycosyltransferase family 2 protein [Flavobacteriales bacterium]|nr:glycosyltransferase family 2 protein [Flavobacteriales bacterium]